MCRTDHYELVLAAMVAEANVGDRTGVAANARLTAAVAVALLIQGPIGEGAALGSVASGAGGGPDDRARRSA